LYTIAISSNCKVNTSKTLGARDIAQWWMIA
jgi:hypothetical protein